MSSNKGRIRPLTETLKFVHEETYTSGSRPGQSPNKWHNQGTEALHQVMKEEAKGDAVDQATIHENKNEFIKALYGMGEYRLSPEYANVSVDPVRWSQMKQEQRAAYVNKAARRWIDRRKTLQKTWASKKLSISTTESGLPNQLAFQVLSDMWKRARNHSFAFFKVIHLEKENFCVTEDDKGLHRCDQEDQNHLQWLCYLGSNWWYLSTFCSRGRDTRYLREHIEDYKKTKMISSPSWRSAMFQEVQGAKKRQKKPRRGQNNIQQQPLVAEIDPNAVVDSDLDCPKPSRFTEYYHNDEPFQVVFVNDFKMQQPVSSCKVKLCTNSTNCPVGYLHYARRAIYVSNQRSPESFKGVEVHANKKKGNKEVLLRKQGLSFAAPSVFLERAIESGRCRERTTA
ncbi:hypothetical protein OS493_039740 [Desmophyllum pertusum]|uniref:Uncharacterized protein n=1 Tax=Desmophyllum pertusum TaxID=174260 RepID=A0A9W9YH25_9CNID|nr:hypothetical protein OS493_039740 [Desmophyllum pertusum]